MIDNSKIEVVGLEKNYGDFKAVRGVSFNVEKDSILGFLGPNGAGKTTIMKILTGYHFPSSGTASINGVSVTDDPVAVKSLVGYLPENVPLYSDLTVNEYLRFIAEARLIPKTEISSKINAAIESCALGSKKNSRIETLSKGYKQRTGLAQAILHDPPILILDEPTTGLDPNQIIEIRSLIKDLGKRKTVILSTHIMQEVEAICNKVLILNEGKIAAQGTPESISGTMKGGENWALLLKGAEVGEIKNKLKNFADSNSLSIDIRSIENSGGSVAVSFFIQSGDSNNDGNDNSEKIFDWAVGSSLKILSMNKKKLSLEDIFVKLTNESAA
jgi:ABC-2 type transport system ATP-binding protein